jgi:hypothetical protein
MVRRSSTMGGWIKFAVMRVFQVAKSAPQ